MTALVDQLPYETMQYSHYELKNIPFVESNFEISGEE